MKKNKRKKVNKKKIILISLSIILVLLILGIGIWLLTHNKDNNDKKEENIVQIKDNMENYDYFLTDNATEYYETLYEELKTILNEEIIDEEKFASTIAKLFVTDVFTLDNKLSSSDIGGLQFIHSNFEEDFVNIAKTTLYSGVESNIYGDRNQILPVVKNVEITNITPSTFKYNKVSHESYKVTVSITYEVDLDYPTKYNLVLIKNDKYWQVVKGE